MSRKQKERVRLTALNIFFIVLCFITLIPILYSISVSLNGQNTLLSSDFSFIPKNFSLENYRRVLLVKIFSLGLATVFIWRSLLYPCHSAQQFLLPTVFHGGGFPAADRF